MPNEDFNDVRAFHEKFDLPRGHTPIALSREHRDFRVEFLREEVAELDAALDAANLVGAVDALVDFVYVAYGTALFIGVPSHLTWPEFIDWDVSPPRLPPTIRSRFAAVKHLNVAVSRIAAAELDPVDALGEIHLAAREAYTIAALLGTPWAECWAAVQAANLTKVRGAADGSNSKRGSAFDVVKPAGWRAPDTAHVAALTRRGWRLPITFTVDEITGKVTL